MSTMTDAERIERLRKWDRARFEFLCESPLGGLITFYPWFEDVLAKIAGDGWDYSAAELHVILDHELRHREGKKPKDRVYVVPDIEINEWLQKLN